MSPKLIIYHWSWHLIGAPSSEMNTHITVKAVKDKVGW